MRKDEEQKLLGRWKVEGGRWNEKTDRGTWNMEHENRLWNVERENRLWKLQHGIPMLIVMLFMKSQMNLTS